MVLGADARAACAARSGVACASALRHLGGRWRACCWARRTSSPRCCTLVHAERVIAANGVAKLVRMLALGRSLAVEAPLEVHSLE